MRYSLGISILFFFISTSFGAEEKNLLKNGDLIKKTLWKYSVGSYKTEKGNQFLRLKASNGYKNGMSQKVKLAVGTYKYSFKIRGHNKASISVTAAPSAYYYHKRRVFASTSFDSIATKEWTTATGTISIPSKKYKYFSIWLYTSSGYQRDKNYYVEIDDVVLTKR